MSYSKILVYFRQKINNAQHNFMARKSVDTDLAEFVDCCGLHVTSRGRAGSLYFDLTEYLHLANHEVLLDRLYRSWVCGRLQHWFMSHLDLCGNVVKVLDRYSHVYCSLCGILQN